MLKIKNLNKTYISKNNQQVKAIDHTSLTFGDSGLIFIVGTSGSGKTTLLNAISGMDHVDSGEIIVENEDITTYEQKELDTFRREKVGIVFQNFNLFDDMNVYENLALPLKIMGVNPKDISRAIEETLHLVGLTGYEKRKINELSAGQMQRIAIARGIIKRPQILLLDEPTGNLDEKNTVAVFELLKVISQNCLVILVSHDLVNANRFADEIISVSDGKVVSVSRQEGHGNKRIAKVKVVEPKTKKEILIENNKDLFVKELLVRILQQEPEEKKEVLEFEIEYEDLLCPRKEKGTPDYTVSRRKQGLSFADKWNLSLSNLKTRKGRLFVTFVLFVLTAFYTLIMLSMLRYDHNTTMLKYLKDNQISEYSVSKTNAYVNKIGEEKDIIVDNGKDFQKEIEKISGKDHVIKEFILDELYGTDEEHTISDVCAKVYHSYEKIQPQIQGEVPEKYDEIVISDYLADQIFGTEDVIGKTVNSYDMQYHIVGVEKTEYKENEDRYNEYDLQDLYGSIMIDESYVQYLKDLHESVRLKACDFTQGLSIDGYTDSYMKYMSLNDVSDEILLAGRMPEASNEVIVSSFVAKRILSDESSESFTDDVVYEVPDLKGNPYNNAYDVINLYDYFQNGIKVVGIFDPYKDEIYEDTDVLVSDEIYKKLCDDYYDYYFYDTIRYSNDNINKEILEKFDEYNISIDDGGSYYIYEFESFIKNIQMILYAMFFVAASIFIFFLISYVSYSISDRKRKIGIMRSMGIAIGDIKQIFISNIVLLSLVCILCVTPLYLCAVHMINEVFYRNYVGDTYGIQKFDVVQMKLPFMMLVELIFVVIAVLISLVPIVKMGKKTPISMLNEK